MQPGTGHSKDIALVVKALQMAAVCTCENIILYQRLATLNVIALVAMKN
jgi:hypothetical protein